MKKASNLHTSKSVKSRLVIHNGEKFKVQLRFTNEIQHGQKRNYSIEINVIIVSKLMSNLKTSIYSRFHTKKENTHRKQQKKKKTRPGTLVADKM